MRLCLSSDLSRSIILLVVLLLFSVYFSMAETAITAAGKGKLLAMADDYPHRRKGFLWLADNIAKAINVTLIGNNLVNIAASAVATTVAVSIFGAAGTAIAVAVMTMLIVIFCEILPKNTAISNKENVLLLCLPLLNVLSILLSPVTWLIQAILRAIGRITGTELGAYSALASKEEIDHIVTESSAAGELEEDERKMIHGVIAFEDTRVSEVMAPRTDVFAIEAGESVEEAVKIFMESGHSRIPVYKEDLDEIIGILYAKDLLSPLLHGENATRIENIMRKSLYVPETMKTDEVLDEMKKSHKHMAVVVDEYGGTAGIVTLEDLIEEIVGDIQDEYDKEKEDIVRTGEKCYTVQGHVNLEDLAEALDYPFNEIFEEVDTTAGMILELAGNFPQKGQVMAYGPWQITVKDVKNHRILEAEIKLIKKKQPETSDDE